LLEVFSQTLSAPPPGAGVTVLDFEVLVGADSVAAEAGGLFAAELPVASEAAAGFALVAGELVAGVLVEGGPYQSFTP
jgi:hypothetical protein